MAISPRLAQSFGVRLVEAKAGTLAAGFSAPGTLVVDERTIVAVQARVQGYVEKLLVRATYDSVRAGQPLAELYVPEWLAAQEELLALKGSAQPGAAALVDAARARLGLLGMPAAEIARVEREGRPSARVTITAPQAGVVWEIGARDGMAVMQGTTLFRLAGLGSVWVVAEVPEAQAGALRTGAPVEATIAAFPGRVFKGTVSTLLPEVNAATRTVRARIVLANPDVSLKPGMFATVQFAGAAPSEARPAGARRGGDPHGQAERRDRRAGRRPVRPGRGRTGTRERRQRRDPEGPRARREGRRLGAVHDRFRGEPQGSAGADGRRRRGASGPARRPRDARGGRRAGARGRGRGARRGRRGADQARRHSRRRAWAR